MKFDRNTLTKDQLLLYADLAQELGLTVDTLGRWERRRKGPACVRAGRKIFYRMSVVQDWLQSQEMPRVTETKPGKARGRK